MTTSPVKTPLPSKEATPLNLALLLWFFYLLAVVVVKWAKVGHTLSPDDAMRLTQVRDFMNGQGWFDLIQHRLDPPNTFPIHWSRLVDAPLAGLVWLFELFMPRAEAERAMLALWAPLLVLPMVLGMMAVVREAIGRETEKLTIFLLAGSPMVFVHFQPGAIDHHNVQAILEIWLMAMILRADRSSRAAMAAGVITAVALAIGPECTPYVGAACLLIGLFWCWQGEAFAKAASRFGVSFALSTLAMFFINVGPARYGIALCDSISITHVAGSMVGGLGLAALAGTNTSPRMRWLGAFMLGISAVCAMVMVGAGYCLADPQPLPADIKELWFDKVSEAQNLWDYLENDWTEAAITYAIPIVTLVIGLWALSVTAGRARRLWIMLYVFLLVSAAISMWQVRGCYMANVISLPFLIWAARRLGKPGEYKDWSWLRPSSIILLVVCNTLFVGIVVHLVLKPLWYGDRADRIEQKGKDAWACFARSAFTPLNGVPTGLIFNTIDTGAPVLTWSPHSVVVAPYHRQVRGLSDAIHAFTGSTDFAHAIVQRRGAQYVLICKHSPEIEIFTETNPKGFMAELDQDKIPSWLESVPLKGDTPLRLYRVKE